VIFLKMPQKLTIGLTDPYSRKGWDIRKLLIGNLDFPGLSTQPNIPFTNLYFRKIKFY